VTTLTMVIIAGNYTNSLCLVNVNGLSSESSAERHANTADVIKQAKCVT
jgi:hypothetical protein